MKLTNKNRLSVVCPSLIQEWDLNRNYPLTPADVFSNSHKKVFWKCKKCKNVWKARIGHRSKGSGCPKCAKIRYKKQSLLSALPKINKIWHPTKNKLKPDMVGRCSDRKAWFICKKNHIWQAAIYSVYSYYKKGRVPCPYCSGKKVDEKTCLATVFPDIAREWHPTKNGNLTPKDVGKGSTTAVWWICEKGHEWKTSVNIRTFQGTKCPYCTSSRLSIENNLAAKNPLIAKLWHPTKNNGITPFQVTPKTHDTYWWKCKAGHEWRTRVSHLVNGFSNCPICNKIRLKDGSNFKSFLEAFWYIKFKKLGFRFKHDNNYPENSKIGKSKYDFYFPELNLYVEVTSYNKKWKYWKKYDKRIKRKRYFVEKILHANFCFIQYILSSSDRNLVNKYIKD